MLFCTARVLPPNVASPAPTNALTALSGIAKIRYFGQRLGGNWSLPDTDRKDRYTEFPTALANIGKHNALCIEHLFSRPRKQLGAISETLLSVCSSNVVS